jgi:hypothetical protein
MGARVRAHLPAGCIQRAQVVPTQRAQLVSMRGIEPALVPCHARGPLAGDEVGRGEHSGGQAELVKDRECDLAHRGVRVVESHRDCPWRETTAHDFRERGAGVATLDQELQLVAKRLRLDRQRRQPVLAERVVAE